MGKKNSASTTLTLEEKYRLYEASVQCPDFDVEFLKNRYKEINGKLPETFREDFCGTGAMACEWVKLGRNFKAVGLDFDEEPIEIGKKRHYAKLSPGQKERVAYIKKDVLKSKGHKADVIAAMNFSYFIFKKRATLLKYFKEVYTALNSKGIFCLDLYGGLETQQLIVDEVDHKDFVYFWDCDYFNPVTNEAVLKIHFKDKKSGKKFRDVFVYDWRLWSLPELRDILEEAGFDTIKTFWEEDDDDGGGNGNYYETTEEENCDAWVSYLVAQKK